MFKMTLLIEMEIKRSIKWVTLHAVHISQLPYKQSVQYAVTSPLLIFKNYCTVTCASESTYLLQISTGFLRCKR